MAQLTNRMDVSATLAAAPIDAQSTVTLELGNMNLLKTASQNPWLDGDLTYTVTLHNIEESEDITDIVFTDMIDITKSRLLTNTLTINGVPKVLGTDFTYDPATGELVIEYADTLAPGQTVTITFQVRKV